MPERRRGSKGGARSTPAGHPRAPAQRCRRLDLPPAVLKIPAGVAHGCRAIGGEPAHLFYVTSRTYDPDEEGRIAYDDPTIGYDWLREPPIK